VRAEQLGLGLFSLSSYLLFIAGFLWTLFGHSHSLTLYNSSQSFNVRCTEIHRYSRDQTV
jgi:hypothetical protein